MGRRCLIVLLTLVLAGCGKSDQERNLGLQQRGGTLDHDALLAEYEKIADRAGALAGTASSSDASAVAEMDSLKKKVADLMYQKLNLFKQETLEQAQRYDAVSAKFQAAIHAFCPTCPGRK